MKAFFTEIALIGYAEKLRLMEGLSDAEDSRVLAYGAVLALLRELNDRQERAA